MTLPTRPPKRIEEFAYREFHVILAQAGSQFRAIARDGQKQPVVDLTGEALDEVRAEVKRRLAQMSQDFVSVNSAINLLGRVFSNGFECEFYKHYERNYKDKSVRFVIEQMEKGRLRGLLDSHNFSGFADVALRALSTSNLHFSNEQMALNDALKKKDVSERFTEDLYGMLYEDFYSALDDLARLLKPYNAAKWPILTFWFPDTHMFLKPTIVQTCAKRMGFELHYNSTPNRETYRSLLDFTQFLRRELATLRPKDNIDLQTFMYVVGKEGYVRHAIEDREAWEAGQPAG